MTDGIKQPLFTWISPCKFCPTEYGNEHGHDPECIEYASYSSRPERMEMTFPCAWRRQGFCHANQKLMHYGIGKN